MHRWPSLFRVTLGAALFIVTLSGTRADETPIYMVVKKPLPSTAMMCVSIDDKQFSQGTGFVVDQKARLLVTNSHVVQGKKKVEAAFPEQGGDQARVDREYYLRGKATRCEGLVVYDDPKHDLALIEMKSLPGNAPELKLSEKGPRIGERVHTTGNPRTSNRAFTYTAGLVKDVVYEEGLRGGRSITVATDEVVAEGASGSPVVNDKGELVGVLNSGPKGGGRMAGCIDLKEVRGFLGDAHRGMATVALRKERYDEAIALCTRALEFNSGDPLSYNERGVAYSYRDRYDDAIADYTQALKIDPKLARAYRNRGSAYFHKSDFSQTISDCTEAILLDPKYAMAYLWRSRALAKLNKSEEAHRDYERARKLDPSLK